MTYEELISKLDEHVTNYNAFIISIDGMTGAGMDTLAAFLSTKYGAPVIHMKDFVLPKKERSQHAEDEIAGLVDFNRIEEQITIPWMSRKPLILDLYEEDGITPKERIALPDATMYILEGTYASHPQIADIFDLKLFCKTSKDAQKVYAQANEISQKQLDAEDTYFVTYMTELLSDGVLGEDFHIPEEELAEDPQ